MNHKAKIIKFTELTVKIAIVLLGIWILYKRVFANQDVSDVFKEIKTSFTDNRHFILMLFALLLVPFNIFLEGIKWKIQLKPIEKISYWKSFLSIFTGISAAMFFPNRMGNFIGRIFMLERGDRIKASLISVVGGFSQMIATVSLGLIASLFFYEKHIILISVIIFVLISLLLIMFFNIHLLKYFHFIIPKKLKDKTRDYFEIFSLYEKKELFCILMLSYIRYFLYTFQFVLLVWAFNIPLTYFKAMIPISLTYLLMMIVPFITITEIAVRGSVSILVFEKWLMINDINSSLGVMVFSASSLLWILNIAIPAFIGLILTYRLKFFRNKNEL